MGKTIKRELSLSNEEEIIAILKDRFDHNMPRHKGFEWPLILARLERDRTKIWSLNEMEITGGEPDVVGQEAKTGEYIFFDCSAESPKGRRSLCYDPEALAARKEAKPGNSAIGMAAEMGIAILNEKEYRALQQLGTFDHKTSSWIDTPVGIRQSGGAIFADYRYGQVFIYHNGAQSYYASRGFRASLKV